MTSAVVTSRSWRVVATAVPGARRSSARWGDGATHTANDVLRADGGGPSSSDSGQSRMLTGGQGTTDRLGAQRRLSAGRTSIWPPARPAHGSPQRWHGGAKSAGEPLVEGPIQWGRSRVVDPNAGTVARLRAYRAAREGLASDLVRDPALVPSNLDGSHRHPERSPAASPARSPGLAGRWRRSDGR
jgi:hypothetical protein